MSIVIVQHYIDMICSRIAEHQPGLVGHPCVIADLDLFGSDILSLLADRHLFVEDPCGHRLTVEGWQAWSDWRNEHRDLTPHPLPVPVLHWHVMNPMKF